MFGRGEERINSGTLFYTEVAAEMTARPSVAARWTCSDGCQSVAALHWH